MHVGVGGSWEGDWPNYDALDLEDGGPEGTKIL